MKKTPDRQLPHDEDESPERPSKSALKRAMTALQKLGQALVELPRDALLRVPMPEELAEAVIAARKITDHEGRRRQMQYIGKIMRHVDPEPIEAAMAEIRGESGAATARLHQLEAWRDRLLDDDEALATFAQRYLDDAAVIGSLRTTVRLARKERTEARAPRHQRALFQQLRTLLEEKD